MKRLWALAILALSSSGEAEPAQPKFAVMNGKCHKFTFAGAEATPLCEGKILNVTYPDGHSSFMFTLKDKALVSFYGLDARAIGDKATLRIQKLTLNLLMGTPSTGSPASGECTYTNPYAGPSLVQCRATVGTRRFEATFVSDGNEPDLMK